MGVEGLARWGCVEGDDIVLNYARTIVAALWDFDALHSCLLAVPGGLEIGLGLGLERGPALTWGQCHDASIPGHTRDIVSKAVFHEVCS